MKQHRLRWGLSQEELARLLGKASHSAISRYENEGKIPPLPTLIAYEVVFGLGLKVMAPALYQQIEDDVIARANAFWNELDGSSDPDVPRKRELLLDMIHRAQGKPAGA